MGAVTRKPFIFMKATSYNPWAFTGYGVLQTECLCPPGSYVDILIPGVMVLGEGPLVGDRS